MSLFGAVVKLNLNLCAFIFPQPVNQSSEVMPLTISYSPISVGKLRLWTNFQESINMLHKLGTVHKISGFTNVIFFVLRLSGAFVELIKQFLTCRVHGEGHGRSERDLRRHESLFPHVDVFRLRCPCKFRSSYF